MMLRPSLYVTRQKLYNLDLFSQDKSVGPNNNLGSSFRIRPGVDYPRVTLGPPVAGDCERMHTYHRFGRRAGRREFNADWRTRRGVWFQSGGCSPEESNGIRLSDIGLTIRTPKADRLPVEPLCSLNRLPPFHASGWRIGQTVVSYV